MIKVGDFNIYCEVNDVIDTLIQEGLLDSKTSDKVGYTMVCCPYHGEKKPSSSITTEVVEKGDKTVPKGFFNCFACHSKGNLFEFVSACLGKHDGGFAGIKWIQERFKVEENEASHVNIPSNFKRRSGRRGRIPSYVISEEVLDSYRYSHPYMYERHLDDDYIEFFDIGYDSETNCITFPVKDVQGYVGYISRRSVGKKFHVQELEGIKTNFIWGLYEVLQELKSNPSQEVYICESVLNAIRYWQIGKLAVALLGTGGGNQYKLLSLLSSCKCLVCSLDPDKAGNIGTDKIHKCKELRGFKITDIIYPQWVINEGKDINDLDDEDILSLEYRWYMGNYTVGGEYKPVSNFQ